MEIVRRCLRFQTLVACFDFVRQRIANSHCFLAQNQLLRCLARVKVALFHEGGGEAISTVGWYT